MLFEGFHAPEEEQQQTFTPVDLASIDAARKKAAERRAAAQAAALAAAAQAKAEKSEKSEKPAKGRDAKGEGSDLAAADAGCKDGDSNSGKAGRQRPARGRKAAAAAADEGCRANARLARRDERPDGPTMVSRTTTRDPEGDVRPLRGAADDEKGAKDKSGKDRNGRDAKDGKDTKGPKSAKERAKEAKEAREAKAALSHPSRIWVQVLTGSVRDKMAGEWRGMVRQARALKGHKPFLTPWRSNFRLLTGPFDSDAEAQDFIASLRKDGVSGFQWTSPAGQVVDALPLK